MGRDGLAENHVALRVGLEGAVRPLEHPMRYAAFAHGANLPWTPVRFADPRIGWRHRALEYGGWRP